MTVAAVAGPSPAEVDADGSNSVLGKAQLLLSAFSAGPLQMGLTELSRRAGVSKGSTYRLAQELVQWGLLERVDDQYQLGIRLFELGQRVPLVAVLRAVSRPFLTDLFAETRAAVHLAVLDGPCVMYVEKITGVAHNLPHSNVGGHVPASCTSSGKVLLALHPAAAPALERCRRGGISRMTSLSVGSWPALRGQLVDVRRRAFAVEIQEVAPGFGSVAVPILRTDGAVFAAISAALPLNQLRVDRTVAGLQITAQGISRAVEERLLAGAAMTVR